MKDFKIDFGWSADPIPDQIAAQGLRIKKEFETKVEIIDSYRKSIIGMAVHGLITNEEHQRILHRAIKKLSTFVEDKE